MLQVHVEQNGVQHALTNALGVSSLFFSAVTAPCHCFGGGIFLTDQVCRMPPLTELEPEEVLSGNLRGITIGLLGMAFGGGTT